jgi:hypothetical protein
MKIKEQEPYPLNAYTNRIDGRVQFWFTKKELPLVFGEINDYIDILNKKYSQYQLTYDFSWHYSSADLFWSRPLTEDEKLKVKELRKEGNKKVREQQYLYAKKLAKKYKLIK